MEEYQIHLGLKSGKEFSFMVYKEDKQELLDEIRDLSLGNWYSFLSDDFINFIVDKNEIVSIGISMNKEEILEQDKKNAEIDSRITKNKIVPNNTARAFTQW
jgi:hypothetical protein